MSIALQSLRRVAHKGRLCATRDFVCEFGVSRMCVRDFSDFRTIVSGGVMLSEPREWGDSSASQDRGCGDDGLLAVTSRTFKKLRISAMSGC